MKKISITKKESTQNLFSSLVLSAIFAVMAYLVRSTIIRIAFLIPAIIFALYFLVWAVIILYHLFARVPFSEPEVPKAEAEEVKEDPKPEKKERIYRTYSPIKDRLEDMDAANETEDEGLQDNDEPGSDDMDKDPSDDDPADD